MTSNFPPELRENAIDSRTTSYKLGSTLTNPRRPSRFKPREVAVRIEVAQHPIEPDNLGHRPLHRPLRIRPRCVVHHDVEHRPHAVSRLVDGREVFGHAERRRRAGTERDRGASVDQRSA